jgi:lipoprotein-anchoring transpeptidase ErfK/SrfK
MKKFYGILSCLFLLNACAPQQQARTVTNTYKSYNNHLAPVANQNAQFKSGYYFLEYKGREPDGTVLVSNDYSTMYRVLGRVDSTGRRVAVVYDIKIGGFDRVTGEDLAIKPGTVLVGAQVNTCPSWSPTPEMKARNPYFRTIKAPVPGCHEGDGTLEDMPNPLGPYSINLKTPDGRPTLYRIHATYDEESILKYGSNGCIAAAIFTLEHFVNGFTMPNGHVVKPVMKEFAVKVFQKDVLGIEDGGPQSGIVFKSVAKGDYQVLRR